MTVEDEIKLMVVKSQLAGMPAQLIRGWLASGHIRDSTHFRLWNDSIRRHQQARNYNP